MTGPGDTQLPLAAGLRGLAVVWGIVAVFPIAIAVAVLVFGGRFDVVLWTFGGLAAAGSATCALLYGATRA